METLQEKPSLSFTEAIQLASHRLLDFKGRSRRSEFWWFILVIIIVNIIAGLFLRSQATANTVASTVIMLLGLAVTARRLQDGGHSALWVYISFLSMLANNIYVISSGITDMAANANVNPKELIESMLSPIPTILGIIAFVTSIMTIIFCIMDGKPEANKYGESPKYITETKEETEPSAQM